MEETILKIGKKVLKSIQIFEVLAPSRSEEVRKAELSDNLKQVVEDRAKKAEEAKM